MIAAAASLVVASFVDPPTASGQFSSLKWITDRWVETVPVSGGLRVGVMAIQGAKRPDTDTFYVYLPSSVGGSTLCVEISSRDGRYEGKLEIALANGAQSKGLMPSPFAFVSRHRARIRDLKTDQLAILAHVSSDCTADVTSYVVATWHPLVMPANVTVFLNSRVPTTIVATANGAVTNEARCEDLTDVTTAFNLACPVPIGWITPRDTLYVRKRERRGTRVLNVDTPLPVRR